MKIFISYLAVDGSFAASVKEELDGNGFETFLAHEDIQPTKIWMDNIFNCLKDTDIVLVLLTKSFSESIWCNQEIGIALALDKLIIPVKIDQDPEGFLSKYQALKCRKDEAFPINRMFEIIGASERYGASFRDFLIGVLEDSSSFMDAERNANRVANIKDFTTEQLEKIMKVSIQNNQIYHGFRAKRILLNYIYDYRKKVDQSLYKQFELKL